MCGIAGVMNPARVHDRAGLCSTVAAMAEPIRRRGPDDTGAWVDEAAGVALGFRRLAIVDLSAAGHQPMVSKDGRLVLVFNGEIYNHAALRAEVSTGLGARSWEGHSDTETLLECFAAWGVTRTLERTVGMFALALWDRVEQRLFLARDRFGEKPLYYGWVNGAFVFASELNAIRRHPGFDNPVDRPALALYTEYACVPAPYSIYQHVYKLEPACVLTMPLGAVRRVPAGAPFAPTDDAGFRIARYWSLVNIAAEGMSDPIRSEQEAIRGLEAVLAEAVRLQSMADVPLGAFLSGGLDSSLIVALMQAQASRSVRTFTIGFEEEAFNEARHAGAVARHLGTEHEELYVSAQQARDVIPSLPDIYSEPFADSSQIPTYLVSKIARRHVTVALSGDGGDELFGG
jgi:asparagine synthase (glutamine-hydrolysing)